MASPKGGGVCSAKLWIIAYNQAIKILNTHGVTGYGFADDSCTFIGGINLEQMMSRTQKVVNDLLGGTHVGFSLTLTKQFALFLRKVKL